MILLWMPVLFWEQYSFYLSISPGVLKTGMKSMAVLLT